MGRVEKFVVLSASLLFRVSVVSFHRLFLELGNTFLTSFCGRNNLLRGK